MKPKIGWGEAVLRDSMSTHPVPNARAPGAKKESLAVTVGGRNIYEISSMPGSGAERVFQEVGTFKKEATIAQQVLKEINAARLGFLTDVGLDYLTLSRLRRNPIRRRGSEDKACYSNWFWSYRSFVYSG